MLVSPACKKSSVIGINRYEKKIRIPDAETRARSIANLREAGRLLDLWTLELDEIIAIIDRGLREQRRARLLHKSNFPPTPKIES